MKTIEIKVEGMMCPHCVKHVTDACLKVNGVKDVNTSLENKNTVITCLENVKKEELIAAITNAGYEAK